MSDLANVIKLDQAMTSLILRWVNSGYYSIMSNLVSIEQAITFLGHRTVQNLVLSASIASYMNQPLPGYELEKGELWKRSVGMAAGAKLIIQDNYPDLIEDAYYAGLFCDIGKLAFHVLVKKINIDWEIIGDTPFHIIEQQLFGYDHATVGAAIVQRWNLANHLTELIQFHHSPSEVNEKWRAVAYAVHAADAVMMMFGIGTGLDSLQYALDPVTLTIFNCNEDSLSEIYDRLSPIIEESNTFIDSYKTTSQ
ncbi:MAG: HDOD domain-containing protein [Anaerolineaceae bacterium]|nr:HDOD domain-containing protein [Anaerolineaceae bacterium]